MDISMSKTTQILRDGTHGANMVSFEQYLPKVYGYIQYWVKDVPVAESLTLSALKQSLSGNQSYVPDTESLSKRLFSAARDTVQDYLEKNQTISVQSNRSNRDMEIMSLKFGARLGNNEIACILGLSQSAVGKSVSQSLFRLMSDFGN